VKRKMKIKIILPVLVALLFLIPAATAQTVSREAPPEWEIPDKFINNNYVIDEEAYIVFKDPNHDDTSKNFDKIYVSMDDGTGNGFYVADFGEDGTVNVKIKNLVNREYYTLSGCQNITYMGFSVRRGWSEPERIYPLYVDYTKPKINEPEVRWHSSGLIKKTVTVDEVRIIVSDFTTEEPEHMSHPEWTVQSGIRYIVVKFGDKTVFSSDEYTGQRIAHPEKMVIIVPDADQAKDLNDGITVEVEDWAGHTSTMHTSSPNVRDRTVELPILRFLFNRLENFFNLFPIIAKLC